MDSKETEKFTKKALDVIRKNLDDIVNSKTFVCSMYFLKYLKDKDQDSFNKFISLFEKLKYVEMLQVMANVHVNLNKESEKIKIKI